MQRCSTHTGTRVGICIMVATIWIMFAGLRGVLVTRETALAQKKGGDDQGERRYVVDFELDADKPVRAGVNVNGGFNSPTYLPASSAKTRESGFSAWFARHDLDATVVTSTGKKLTDDVSVHVRTDEAGNIVSFQLIGQDVVGTEGIIHKSQVVVIDPPVAPSADGFTLHVEVDNLEIWKYDKHWNVGGAQRVEMIGRISVGDLVYTPVTR